MLKQLFSFSPKKRKHFNLSYNWKIHNKPIVQVKDFKNFGIHFQTSTPWSHQISKLSFKEQKASNKIIRFECQGHNYMSLAIKLFKANILCLLLCSVQPCTYKDFSASEVTHAKLFKTMTFDQLRPKLSCNLDASLWGSLRLCQLKFWLKQKSLGWIPGDALLETPNRCKFVLLWA